VPVRRTALQTTNLFVYFFMKGMLIDGTFHLHRAEHLKVFLLLFALNFYIIMLQLVEQNAVCIRYILHESLPDDVVNCTFW